MQVHQKMASRIQRGASRSEGDLRVALQSPEITRVEKESQTGRKWKCFRCVTRRLFYRRKKCHKTMVKWSEAHAETLKELNTKTMLLAQIHIEKI